ncbi:MAG: PilZ domain protein [Candidatus Scalindua rubra]|uniref:PilZ domain protein n=1 Tax=Candidatus Scalindua rubra TaxID=1872076 RepID=A0A1E3X6E5_9BACT|nr:MAG: PilZ domain protein [Candidatus Scalindua rubra]
MLNNKRFFSRVKVDIKVGFELVKWNERDLDHCKNSYETSIVDISAKGANLSDLPNISKGLLKKLSTGKNKIRLNFSLYADHDPINTFARLIWHQQPDKEGIDKKRYGFEFIDIPNTAFERIKEFVDSAGN